MLSMVPGAQEVPSVGALEQNGYSQAWGESFKIQSLGRQVGKEPWGMLNLPLPAVQALADTPVTGFALSARLGLPTPR